jgi:hypothetical protein
LGLHRADLQGGGEAVREGGLNGARCLVYVDAAQGLVLEELSQDAGGGVRLALVVKVEAHGGLAHRRGCLADGGREGSSVRCEGGLEGRSGAGLGFSC